MISSSTAMTILENKTPAFRQLQIASYLGTHQFSNLDFIIIYLLNRHESDIEILCFRKKYSYILCRF